MSHKHQHVPKVVAFDLDACSWETEMYLLDGPPFRFGKDGQLYDRSGSIVALFKDTHDVLREISHSEKWKDTQIAYVSRTSYPEYAHECLKLLKIGDNGHTMHSFYLCSTPLVLLFIPFHIHQRSVYLNDLRDHIRHFPVPQVAHHFEIYPGSKVTHFQHIHKRTGIPYNEMLFFDNEYRNIRDVQRLGVKCVFTPEGFRRKYWEEGLRKLNQ
eukprot:gene5094-8774_t